MSKTADENEIERVWRVLEAVPDPEMPMISVVELGLIASAAVADGAVRVKLTPSFAACPAIDHMRGEIVQALSAAGFDQAAVDIVFDPPWNSDRITAAGLEKLKLLGVAPPRKMGGREVEPSDLQGVACPLCDSRDSKLESSFGPTLCRSIHYCKKCQQSFEHFKPVS